MIQSVGLGGGRRGQATKKAQMMAVERAEAGQDNGYRKAAQNSRAAGAPNWHKATSERQKAPLRGSLMGQKAGLNPSVPQPGGTHEEEELTRRLCLACDPAGQKPSLASTAAPKADPLAELHSMHPFYLQIVSLSVTGRAFWGGGADVGGGGGG